MSISTLGEGYGADELVRLMNRNGITNYLVSVGGAVSSRGVNGGANHGEWRSKADRP